MVGPGRCVVVSYSWLSKKTTSVVTLWCFHAFSRTDFLKETKETTYQQE